MINPCKECEYYHKENNTCQSKKCATSLEGYVTWFDGLCCNPYHYKSYVEENNMLSFSTRRKLAEKYEQWLNESRDFKPANIPQTVIDWLTIEKLLDEDKIKSFLNSQ